MPDLHRASGTELAKTLTDAQIDPLLQTAILSGDRRRLENLLSAKSNVCCLIHG